MSPTPIEASAPAARVLVIDDETQIRRFLDISLRAQGYQDGMPRPARKAWRWPPAKTWTW